MAIPKENASASIIDNIDEQTLKKMFPNAKLATLQAMARTSENAFRKYKVTAIKLANALGQVNVESGGLTVFVENLNYKAKRILEVFGARHSAKVTASEANKLANNPKALAMRVYGTGKKAIELGNETPEQGWLYRGGSPMQLTGRSTYKAVGPYAGLDLVNFPETARNPEYAWDMIFGFYAWKGIHARLGKDISDENISYITLRTNGGQMHLYERKVATNKFYKIILDNCHVIPTATPARLVSEPVEEVVVVKPTSKKKKLAGEVSPPPAVAKNKKTNDGQDIAPSQQSREDAEPVEDDEDEIDEAANEKADEVDIELLNDSIGNSILTANVEKILAEYGAQDNEYIKEFQTLMNDRNYHLGAEDGYFGNLTRDILFAFQADNAFKVEPVLRIKHLQTARTAPNRPLGEARVNVEKTNQLSTSTTVTLSSRLQKIAGGALAFLGIGEITSESSWVAMGKAIFGERSGIVEGAKSAFDFLALLFASRIFWIGLFAVIIYIAWSIKKDRLKAHMSGENLGRSFIYMAGGAAIAAQVFSHVA